MSTTKEKVPLWAKVVVVGFIGTITFGIGTLFILLLVGISEC